MDRPLSEELAAHLRETSEALDRSLALLVERPDDFYLTVDVASLEKRQATLQERLIAAKAEASA